MRKVKVEKIVLSVSGTADKLEKGLKIIERITGKKATRRSSRKRIPSLGVRPGLEVGAMVTIRGDEAVEMLRRLLHSVDNQLRRKQLTENSFTFGIKEYIEIPGMQYQRDIGIIGLDVSVSFVRAGRRVALKKIKAGRLPKKQAVSPEEIQEYLTNELGVSFR
jgi:large subunit ribosomal protein L5